MEEYAVCSTSNSLSHDQFSYSTGLKTQSLRALRGSFWFSGLRAILIVVVVCPVAVGGTLELAYHYGFFPFPPTPASTIIEIASDYPTSGLDKIDSLPMQDAVQMAINEANRNNLLPVYTLQLKAFDNTGKGDRHDPDKGKQNVQQAIADNLVAGIIGPDNSSVAYAEMPITNGASIAQIGYTSYPCLTKSSAVDPADCSGPDDTENLMRPTGQLTYFRLVTADDIQGKDAADYLFNTKHYIRVILFKDDTDIYGRGFARAFQREWKSLGGLLIAQDLPEATISEQDYQDALQSLVSFGVRPDLVYFVGNSPNGNYVLQALTNIHELKTVAFAGSDGIADDTILKLAPTLHLSVPVYVSLPIVDPAHSGTVLGSNFQSNFMASGYANYFSFAASAYDSTMILIQAIRTALQHISTPHGEKDQVGAQKFRQAVLQALRQNMYTDGTGTTHSSYTGATGTHSFDSNGDITNPTVSFYQLDLTTQQPSWRWIQ